MNLSRYSMNSCTNIGYIQSKTLRNHAMKSIFDKYANRLACAAAFLLPLKLSLCLIALLPLISLWLILNFKKLKDLFFDPAYLHISRLYVFLICAIYSSFFGIDFIKSLQAWGSIVFFSFTAFAIAAAAASGGFHRIAMSLLAGQTLAGMHSIFELLFPRFEGKIFLGKVTESGQITLTFLVALGFTLYYLKKGTSSGRLKLLSRLTLPVLGLTLLANLKRGPWIGVILGSAIYLNKFSRRLVAPALILVCALFIFVQPLRERLMTSYDHFAISGGRKVIWDIGGELAIQYPLGIGYNNSDVLRKFSTEIPEELKHFHNNLLNVLVETGWLGLLLYLWWIFKIVELCWRGFDDFKQQILARAIGCSIISWQVAGLVEYNFGDSEVFLTAMVILGLLAALKLEARDT